MIAHNPLHGSQRAGLPHWALASGDNAKSPQGIGMSNARGRQPAPSEPPHPLPGDASGLATPPQRATPEPPNLKTERDQRRAVHRHPVVLQMPVDDRAQPSAHLRDGSMQTSPQLGFHLAQLRLQPLPDRLPHHREPSVPLLPADVREAEDVERLRLPLAGASPVFGRIGPEFQQSRLLGVQLQPELCEPFTQLSQEPFSVRPVLKPHDEVVRIPHDDHVAVGVRLPPSVSPKVEHVVQVHVCQERRNTAPLGRAFFTPCPRPVLQHAGAEPLLDQPHDAPVRNPVLDELHQPLGVNGLENPTDVGIEVGIELERARCRRRVTSLALSIARWDHISTVATFPEAPLRSRTVGFPESGSDLGSLPLAFPSPVRLKRWRAYPPLPAGLLAASPRLRKAITPRLCVRESLRPRDRQVSRAPLPAAGATRSGTTSCVVSKGVVPSSSLIWAHAPGHLPPTVFGLGLDWWVFAACRQSLLGDDPSRRDLRESFLGCLGPCHGGPLGALARYFPNGIGLPSWVRGRRPASTRSATSERKVISQLQPFTDVQASKCACHPGRSYRGGPSVRRAAVALTPEQYTRRHLRVLRLSLPSERAIDGRGLSPHQSPGLVGYSHPVHVPRQNAGVERVQRVVRVAPR